MKNLLAVLFVLAVCAPTPSFSSDARICIGMERHNMNTYMVNKLGGERQSATPTPCPITPNAFARCEVAMWNTPEGTFYLYVGQWVKGGEWVLYRFANEEGKTLYLDACKRTP